MKRQLEDSYRRAGEADAEARRVFEVHDFSSGQFIKCRSSQNLVRKCAPSPFQAVRLYKMSTIHLFEEAQNQEKKVTRSGGQNMLYYVSSM